MLQFAGGVALGMDIGDLLELQRAFHGQRIVGVAAEIEDVPDLGQLLGHLLDLALQPQHLAGIARRLGKLTHQRLLLIAADGAARCRDPQRQRRQHRQLAGERFGRRHADFRSGERRQGHVRLAGDGRFLDVDHGADRHPRLAAVAQRGERVGGFARLRDEQRRAHLGQRHLAVAELGGDVDVDGKPRVALEPVFADQPGEIGCPAGRDRQAVDGDRVERQLDRFRAAGGEVQIVGKRVGDHLGLLMDLLLHEMPVIALVDQERCAHRLPERPLDLGTRHVEDLHLAAPQDRPVAVFQIGDLVGERSERNGIGAEEHLALAVADGQRRAVARADDQVVVAFEHDGQRKRALQPLQCRKRGFDRLFTACHLAGDQMGDHLGVGLRLEAVAVLGQFVAQFGEVLDDAVMDHRNAFGEMRVRVGLVGHAMGGPAGMADADVAAERLLAEQPLQIDELPGRPAPRQGAAIQRGDPGQVVAAIFEPFQGIDDQRRDAGMSDYCNDSTHLACPDGDLMGLPMAFCHSASAMPLQPKGHFLLTEACL